MLNKMHSCAFGHVLSYNILGLCVHDWTAKRLTGLMRYLLCNSLLFLSVSHCTVSSCWASRWKKGLGNRYKGQPELGWPAGGRLSRARTLWGGRGRGAEGLSQGCREAKARAGSSRGGWRSSGSSRHSRPRGPSRLLGKQGSCGNTGDICITTWVKVTCLGSKSELNHLIQRNHNVVEE